MIYIPGLKPGAEMLHPFRVRVVGCVMVRIPGWNPGLKRRTPLGSEVAVGWGVDGSYPRVETQGMDVGPRWRQKNTPKGYYI